MEEIKKSPFQPYRYRLTNKHEPEKPWTFYIFGCAGNGSVSQKNVAKLMDEVAKTYNEYPIFLITGDLLYPKGASSPTAKNFETHFHQVYDAPELEQIDQCTKLVFPGNHDQDYTFFGGFNNNAFKLVMNEVQHTWVRNNNLRKMLLPEGNTNDIIEIDIQELKSWTMPHRYYSVEIDDGKIGDGKTEIFCVDTSNLVKEFLTYINNKDSGKEMPDNQAKWLIDAWHNKSNAKYKIFSSHHPLYTWGKRYFESDHLYYLTQNDYKTFDDYKKEKIKYLIEQKASEIPLIEKEINEKERQLPFLLGEIENLSKEDNSNPLIAQLKDSINMLRTEKEELKRRLYKIEKQLIELDYIKNKNLNYNEMIEFILFDLNMEPALSFHSHDHCICTNTSLRMYTLGSGGDDELQQRRCTLKTSLYLMQHGFGRFTVQGGPKELEIYTTNGLKIDIDMQNHKTKKRSHYKNKFEYVFLKAIKAAREEYLQAFILQKKIDNADLAELCKADEIKAFLYNQTDIPCEELAQRIYAVFGTAKSYSFWWSFSAKISNSSEETSLLNTINHSIKRCLINEITKLSSMPDQVQSRINQLLGTNPLKTLATMDKEEFEKSFCLLLKEKVPTSGFFENPYRITEKTRQLSQVCALSSYR